MSVTTTAAAADTTTADAAPAVATAPRKRPAKRPTPAADTADTDTTAPESAPADATDSAPLFPTVTCDDDGALTLTVGDADAPLIDSVSVATFIARVADADVTESERAYVIDAAYRIIPAKRCAAFKTALTDAMGAALLGDNHDVARTLAIAAKTLTRPGAATPAATRTAADYVTAMAERIAVAAHTAMNRWDAPVFDGADIDRDAIVAAVSALIDSGIDSAVWARHESVAKAVAAAVNRPLFRNGGTATGRARNSVAPYIATVLADNYADGSWATNSMIGNVSITLADGSTYGGRGANMSGRIGAHITSALATPAPGKAAGFAIPGVEYRDGETAADRERNRRAGLAPAPQAVRVADIDALTAWLESSD